MVHFTIKKGLNIPLISNYKEEICEIKNSPLIGLDLSFFSSRRLRLVVNISGKVQIGQPIAEDKLDSRRKFISQSICILGRGILWKNEMGNIQGLQRE